MHIISEAKLLFFPYHVSTLPLAMFSDITSAVCSPSFTTMLKDSPILKHPEIELVKLKLNPSCFHMKRSFVCHNATTEHN